MSKNGLNKKENLRTQKNYVLHSIQRDAAPLRSFCAG